MNELRVNSKFECLPNFAEIRTILTVRVDLRIVDCEAHQESCQARLHYEQETVLVNFENARFLQFHYFDVANSSTLSNQVNIMVQIQLRHETVHLVLQL